MARGDVTGLDEVQTKSIDPFWESRERMRLKRHGRIHTHRP